MHCGAADALAHVTELIYTMRAPFPPAVRYGRVPKRPREPVVAESLPEPKRPTPTTAILPPSDPMETEVMRQQMSKELVRLITLAHRQTNTCTDEVKAMMQPRAIVLRVEDSEGEGG